jgi:GNAT superfamily N-acetyltransferase
MGKLPACPVGADPARTAPGKTPQKAKRLRTRQDLVSVLRIEKLLRGHEIDKFDCGRDTLNRFLARYALQNQLAGASQTYLALADEEVVGYYTLVVGQVEYNEASERLTKGLARHPVPIMLLARLAVAVSWQGKGLGSGLLKDAMLRTLQAADIAGIRAFAVHAKDDAARAFYIRYDLVE